MDPDPATPDALPSARSFTAVPRWLLILFGCLLLLLGLLVIPYFVDLHHLRHPTCGLSKNVINLRNLGIFLFAFEEDFGSFPTPATARILAAKHQLDPLPATTSNDLLSQLILGEYTDSEEIFHARHPKLPQRKPDNVISPPTSVLEPGECGFSYVAGLSTTSPGECPLLLAPMIPGTTTFDRKAWNGRAVFLRVDQSVKQYELDKHGRVILPNGLDLFNPAQPFWNGKSPDLRHPAR